MISNLKGKCHQINNDIKFGQIFKEKLTPQSHDSAVFLTLGNVDLTLYLTSLIGNNEYPVSDSLPNCNLVAYLTLPIKCQKRAQRNENIFLLDMGIKKCSIMYTPISNPIRKYKLSARKIVIPKKCEYIIIITSSIFPWTVPFIVDIL